MLRAATKVARAHPDWARFISQSHGGSFVFFNQASVSSRAMGRIMSDMCTAYHSPRRAERVWYARGRIVMTDVMERPDVLAKVQKVLADPERLAPYQRAVRWHIEERDGGPEVAR